MIHQGDCVEVMASMPADSIHAVVCDPPYGLEFLGAEWDKLGAYQGPLGGGESEGPWGRKARVRYGTTADGMQAWHLEWCKAAFRVLRPGGYMLAFGGSRTFHRMTCAIEDAGFEIRDAIMWIYGCLDEATECLTRRGWVHYSRLNNNDHALAFDIGTGILRWEPILRVVAAPYCGPMVTIRGEQVDQVLTPNHRAIIHEAGVWRFISAEDLYRLSTGMAAQEPLSGGAKQDVFKGVRSATSAWTQTEATGRSQGSEVDSLRRVREGRVEAPRVVEAGEKADVLPELQRQAAGSGAYATRLQGTCGVDARGAGVFQGKDDGAIESGMEGWGNILPEARELQNDQTRSLPGRMAGDVSPRRLRGGASIGGCPDGGKAASVDGSGPSCGPRSPQQRSVQFGVVGFEPGTQVARVGAAGCVLPSVASVGQELYSGIVWCITVPSGAFVARRGGKMFVTGNSGYPHGMDVTKAIDARGGRAVAWFGPWLRAWREANGITQAEIAELFPSKTGGKTGCVANWELGFNMPTPEQFDAICRRFGLPFDSLEAAEREIVGTMRTTALAYAPGQGTPRPAVDLDVTAPATDPARRWAGWNTSLKPSFEPVIVARRPLEGTVAENLLRHGCGALNVDGCRVPRPNGIPVVPQPADSGYSVGGKRGRSGEMSGNHPLGSWPPNVALTHDAHCDEAGCAEGCPVRELGEQSGDRGISRGGSRGEGTIFGLRPVDQEQGYGDEGTAARFFPTFRYNPKAATWERWFKCRTCGGQLFPGTERDRHRREDGHDAVSHPTQKPVDLMRWLVRLVTPSDGGVVLDPFLGSGTTGVAATLEGVRWIGIERDPVFYEIARQAAGAAEEHVRRFGLPPLDIATAEALRTREDRVLPGQLALFDADGTNGGGDD